MNLYAININEAIDEELVQLLLTKIDSKKRKRLEKFVFRKDLLRSLYGDLILRKKIIEDFDIRNDKIIFTNNKFGKPRCVNLPDFHYNLSHSGDWVICAIDKSPVGIDIEKIFTVDLNISKSFFSNKEHEDLMLSNDPFDYFFTLWSLKESYIKFIGKGLSHPLDSFTMHLKENRIKIESEERILNDIFFKQYNIEEGYKLAACGEKDNFPKNPIYISLEDLLSTFKYN